MKAASLGEARRLFQTRQFSAVIRVLEPEVFRYRDNFDYYYLLGSACLHTGDLGGAFSYLSRAHQITADDANVLLALAAIHLRKGEHEGAIKRWLEVLELDPGNRVATRGLGLLRRGPGGEELQKLIDSGRYRQFFPPLPSRRRWVKALVISLACVVVLGLGYLGYAGYQSSRSRVIDRPGVGAIEIPLDLTRLIETGTDFRYTLTERQVKDGFDTAKKYLSGVPGQPGGGGDQPPPALQRSPGGERARAHAQGFRDPAHASRPFEIPFPTPRSARNPSSMMAAR